MIEKILDHIIDQRQLTTLFQPIVRIRGGEIFGYEALVRGPSDSPLHAAGNLFDVAERHGRGGDLEHLCRELHLKTFTDIGLPGRIFLNVNPRFMTEGERFQELTRRYLERLHLSPERVVIELTENHLINDVTAFCKGLEFFRRLGFAVAIDDLGAGYNGLRLWSELQPDFVKIDRYFIQGIDEDARKRDLVASLLDMSQGLGCQVIAEGIETEAELRVIKTLGIPFGQGYLFARPCQSPPQVLCKEFFLTQKEEGAWSGLRVRSETVGSLARSVLTVSPLITCSEMMDLLGRETEVQFVPVVDAGIYHGLIYRQDLLALMASRYGRDLYGRDPVRIFVDRKTLVVEHDLPVTRLSQMITEDENLSRKSCFVIIRNGSYLGVATFVDLLKTITELQLRYARYANPLTLLPGNVPISEHIDELLKGEQPFAICYLDLDHFKPYNDHYGYHRGDDVLRLLSTILVEAADPNRDFVGHIGGDDFLMVFCSGDWERRCGDILKRFDREIGHFYDEKDRAPCGIWSENRQGEKVFYPFVALSIGAVTTDQGPFQNSYEVSAAASEAKRQSKKIKGSALFVERRKVWCPALVDACPSVTDDMGGESPELMLDLVAVTS